MNENRTESHTVCVVSLGCPKNQVDAEMMSVSLARAGFSFVTDPAEAEVIIVNSCGFLQDAVRETLEVVEDLARHRHEGVCRCLVLAGCLVARYGAEQLADESPADLLMGLDEMDRAGPILTRRLRGNQAELPTGPPEPSGASPEVPPHELRAALGPWAYVKVSEGCGNACAYCTLPAIRGPLVSRSPQAILREVTRLAAQGVCEINLVAQDVTAFGRDVSDAACEPLVELLRSLERIDGIRWLRLLYCHPAHVTDGLVDHMERSDKLTPYLDIPIQHVSDPVLKAMNRSYDEKALRRLVDRIRRARPDVALRSTAMVGFPGETHEDFERLRGFLEEVRFHHLGVFRYSREPGTAAYPLGDTVSEAEKDERYDALMDLQARISEEIHRGYVGTVQEVLVEGYHEETSLLLRARSRYQAPEVDGIVIIQEGHCPQPGIMHAHITDAHVYDLVGRLLAPDPQR